LSKIKTQPPSEVPSDFLGYDLESLPPRSSVSSRSLSYDSLVPRNIPDLPDDVVIKEWSYLATGTHGQVRKIVIQHGDVEEVLCLKLFSERWEEEYHREVYAYAFLIHHQVKNCIPQVYWKGELPLSRWGGGPAPPGDGEIEEWYGDSEAASNQNSSGERIYYGIVMEYFDDFREIDYSKLNVQTGEAVARALSRIHEARILHGDIAERNILLVRKSGKVRPVWIDFSCSWINAYGYPLDREWGAFIQEFYQYAVGPGLIRTDLIRTAKCSPLRSFKDLKQCEKPEDDTIEQKLPKCGTVEYPTTSSRNPTRFASPTPRFPYCDAVSF